MKFGAAGRIAFALVLATVAWGLVHALVSTVSLTATTARADIEDRLRGLTGQEVFVDGPVSFDFLPRPVLTMNEIRIGTGAGPILSVDRLQAQLDLSDAILGRTDIARMTLTRAELTFPAEPAVVDAASAALSPVRLEATEGDEAPETPLAYLRMFFDRFDGVRHVELREGVFRPPDGSLGFSNANLDMRWPARDAPAEVTGSFVWNGQPTQLDMRVGSVPDFLAGRPSPLRLAFASPPMRMDFTGEGAGGESLSMRGGFLLTSPSIPRSAQWLGASAAAFPDLGATSLEGQIEVESERVALSSVTVSLAEQSGQGALEAIFPETGRASVTGTLAFPRLDLSRFARALAPLPRHALDFQRPMAVAFMREFDLDLRLSAGEAGLGDLPLHQFAATIIFSDGRATLDIGDAEVLGGRAQGRFSVDLTGERPRARGRLDLASVEAVGLARVAGLQPAGIEGRANLTAEFGAPATNWRDVLRENEATVRLSIADGTVSGLSTEFLRTPGERPLPIRAGGRTTAFGSIEAELTTRGPYGNLRRLAMRTPEGDVEATGFLSLLDDHLLVEGIFTPALGSAGVFTSSQPIAFKMQGEWPEPTVSVGSGAGPM